jgi:hypothetical protein
MLYPHSRCISSVLFLVVLILFSLHLSNVLLRSLFAMRQSQSGYSSIVLEKAVAFETSAKSLIKDIRRRSLA